MDPTTVALDAIRTYGPLAMLVFTFCEASMLFPFLPSEVVVPFGAAVIVVDPVTGVIFVLATAVGGTVGALIPYEVARRGTTLLDRFGPYVRVDPEDVERSRRWFRRYGTSSVLWGRFLPVLRSVVSIPAGLAEMGRGRFAAYTAVGTAGFNAAIAVLVFYSVRSGPVEVALEWALAHPVVAIALAVVAAGLAVAAWVVVRRRLDWPSDGKTGSTAVASEETGADLEIDSE